MTYASIGSDTFADYREQLVSWDTYHERVADYGATAGLPVDGPAFVEHVRDWLYGVAQATDAGFPDNKLVRIENGEAIITRPQRPTESANVRELEVRLAEHMTEQHILDTDGHRALAALDEPVRANLRPRDQA